MNNKAGLFIGVIALLVFGGRMLLMKNSTERNQYREEMTKEIRMQAAREANKGEFIGSDEGTKLLKESYERKQKHQAAQPQNPLASANPSPTDSTRAGESNEATATVNLDFLVQEKFAPLTGRDNEAHFNPKTNEVSIVFAATLPGGKKIVGSTYLIGSMEKKKGKPYFKPLKWKKEHGPSDSVKEYLLTDMNYIDAKGKLKSGQLKAFWDWGLNGKKPFFFEEI